jgi:uncharacterized repeat protein (TIGR01451 family)
MASRGLWRLMGARTRRSLALSWSALFVLSLLLQYFSFALAPAALAEPPGGGTFQLEGNAVDDGAGDDWANVKAGTSSADATFFLADNANIRFTVGSKDTLDMPSNGWDAQASPDKDDILDAYAAIYKAGSDTVFFGMDRFANNGDANVGFWFFQNPISVNADGSFSGKRTPGDVFVVSAFDSGGQVSNITLYEWTAQGLSAPVKTGLECVSGGVVQPICAVANKGDQTSPWAYTPKSGTAGTFPVASFFEGGVQLDSIFKQGSVPCFSSFLAETRSSTSTTAELKNFVSGSFNTCVPPDISTTSSKSTVHFGESVTDAATLSGQDGPASGTVKFFVCGPSGSAPDCTTGGTQVGGAVTVTTSANGGTATSAAYTPGTAGTYCWRAEYTPDAASQYLVGSHTNQTTECFTVVKNTTAITTASAQTVNVGTAISDSATLSGATADAGGHITFRAYGPADTTCTGTVAFTSSDVAVSGNGTYGPVSFTPVTAGTYRWIASYSGDAKNLPVIGQCNDTGENDVVQPVNPTITTQASANVIVGGKIHDTATVSGGLNPTGTVTFKLYGPNDATCANAAIFTSGPIALSGGSATSGDFTTTQVGTYRWRATYNGDVNNSAVTGACNAANENVVVNPTSPTITTSLVGGGQTGAHITVPLGTAVHDTSTLSGVTADAGGTVHYQVFTDSQCTTLMSGGDAGTVPVTGGVPANSMNITFNHAGTFYWQADYSGDTNNQAASSACNLETVTLDKAIPTITTNASASVPVGGAIHDTATLAGGVGATGTITFNLYGPGDTTCTGTALFTATATVNGNGQYGSGNYTTLAAGTYRWVASYSGDGDNAAASGACNDANENVIVTPQGPTVVTVASASVEVGGAIHDTATLAGGFNPTGSITFNLYGPDNATCAGQAIFTSTVTVTGNKSYDSASFTTLAAGTYRWIANYSGDANNNATANGCNGANENVVVTPKSPTVVTVASASVEVGGKIHDSATLAGGFNPTGSITFHLYGPNDANCTGAVKFTATVPVSGNGVYGSGDFTTTAAGIYHWIANYSGDANNNATANACNGANENVVVTPAHPTISTVATVGAQVGDKIHDTATVSGGFNPTGTVTFNLYGPSDPTCDAAPIFTDAVALGQNGTATSGDFTVLAQGNYRWIASYGGDANNAAVAGNCGDAGETTVVNQYNPNITTVLTSGDLSGAKITVLFGSSVTDQATLSNFGPGAGGTVTYTVFSDNLCQTTFADGGTKTVSNGTVPASDAVNFPNAGTFYWQASYSGDAANAPATSACTDEVVTVTTPNLNIEKLVKVNDGPFVHSNVAQPGDVLTYQITIANSGDGAATNVPVSDDISGILAHATYNDDCSNSCNFAANTLTWTIPTIAAGGSVTLTFSVDLDASFPTGTTDLPNVVVVIGTGSNCAAGSDDANCSTNTTVTTSILNIDKSFTGNSAGTDPDLNVPAANIGDTLHYKLTYHGEGPLTNAVITDVLPQGLQYITGSAAGDAHFTFISYDTVTRTLRWESATLLDPAQDETNSVDGFVTYDVKVLSTAPGFPQPLVNTATIGSDQTPPDSATASVAVLPPVLPLTPPPTTTLTPQNGASNPGFALMLILLAVAGLTLGIGFITPVPARARRRDRRG